MVLLLTTATFLVLLLLQQITTTRSSTSSSTLPPATRSVITSHHQLHNPHLAQHSMFWLLTATLSTLTVMAVALPPVYRHLLRPLLLRRSATIRRLTNPFSSASGSSGKVPPPARSAANLVYTRTGDNGSSGLFSGERRPKDDAIFEALGTTDELTSAIGLAREFVSTRQSVMRDELEAIQCILQDLQATVATPKSSARQAQLARTKWNVDHLVDLETWIDAHSAQLPPLRNFILPSGGRASSSLHLARAICRRAERRLVPLLDDGLELPVLQYLNRLSSYLFTVARVCAREDGFEETVYRRPRAQNEPEEGAAAGGGEEEETLADK